jgi:hypothetical protein
MLYHVFILIVNFIRFLCICAFLWLIFKVFDATHFFKTTNLKFSNYFLKLERVFILHKKQYFAIFKVINWKWKKYLNRSCPTNQTNSCIFIQNFNIWFKSNVAIYLMSFWFIYILRLLCKLLQTLNYIFNSIFVNFVHKFLQSLFLNFPKFVTRLDISFKLLQCKYLPKSFYSYVWIWFFKNFNCILFLLFIYLLFVFNFFFIFFNQHLSCHF